MNWLIVLVNTVTDQKVPVVLWARSLQEANEYALSVSLKLDNHIVESVQSI